MSKKSASTRRKTVELLKKGRRVIIAGALGIPSLTGKKLCRKRFVKINRDALASTKPAPAEPVRLIGRLRPKPDIRKDPYGPCPGGCGKKIKFCMCPHI